MPGILDPLYTITINGIACSDEGSSKPEHFDIYGGNVVERVLRCAWTDRVALQKYLLGGSVQIGGVTIVNAGQPHPDYDLLFAAEVDIVGEGEKSNTATNVVAWERAVLTVKYRPVQYAAGGTVSTTAVDYSSQIITLPRSEPMLKFGDGAAEDLPPEDNPGFQMTTTSFEVTRYGLTSVPESLILAAEASPVNSTSIFGRAAGYIKFGGARSFERTISLGGTVIDLSLRFESNSIGWNYAFDKTGAIRPILKQNGDPLFASSDLNILFA